MPRAFESILGQEVRRSVTQNAPVTGKSVISSGFFAANRSAKLPNRVSSRHRLPPRLGFPAITAFLFLTSGVPAAVTLTIYQEGDLSRGIFIDGPNLHVPVGYLSNTSLDFTTIVRDFRFANLGLREGDTIEVSWARLGVRESLIMSFVDQIPEPSALILLTLATVPLAACRRRANRRTP